MGKQYYYTLYRKKWQQSAGIFYREDRSTRAVCSTSRWLLKAEVLTRTVPVSSVPALRWAKGAQWSPVRTAMPAWLSRCPTS